MQFYCRLWALAPDQTRASNGEWERESAPPPPSAPPPSQEPAAAPAAAPHAAARPPRARAPAPPHRARRAPTPLLLLCLFVGPRCWSVRWPWSVEMPKLRHTKT